jgi:hypothetical protein
MKDSKNIIPPYVGESGTLENALELLFSDSILSNDFESLEEDEEVKKMG